MGLRNYILRRSLYSVLLVFFVITVNFTIFQLIPGDPSDLLAQPGRLVSQQQVNQVLSAYGLTPGTPVYIRYEKYVVNMLTWNFGFSYATSSKVSIDIIARLPNTLLLIGISTILALSIGTILGVLSAYKRGRTFDNVAVITSLTTFSLPTFWIGIMLLTIFFVNLHWFPSGWPYPVEWNAPGAAPNPYTLAGIGTIITGRLQHLFLPTLTLVLFQYGGYLLLTRASMSESLTEDYIVTARAKGLSTRVVLFKHALKNASLPLISNAALSFGFILTGAIITETIFSWQGLGYWIFNAIGFNDTPALQAIFYIVALCVIGANFIADVMLGVVDPRIKYS